MTSAVQPMIVRDTPTGDFTIRGRVGTCRMFI